MKFLNELLHLNEKKIVLASQSPRRVELLRNIGLSFEIHPAGIDENPKHYHDEIDYARQNASNKARWISDRVNADLIISADTIVAMDGQIFEKPASREEAAATLKRLSNNTHQVISAFCLLTNQTEITDHAVTEVTFNPLSGHEIEAYLNSGEPFDKAGAYGIQGLASIFIKEIKGCYYNVMGFPLAQFYQHLKKLEL
ncbi:MAG: Maf family protein [Calditrichota bacterium]